jgi:rRNA maturation endonuclease Nob1
VINHEGGYTEYMPLCKRCKKYFKTPLKFSRICPKCCKPRGGGSNTTRKVERYVSGGKFTAALALKKVGVTN